MEALIHIDQLLAENGDNPSYRFLKAAVQTRIGEYETVIEIYRGILAEHPVGSQFLAHFGPPAPATPPELEVKYQSMVGAGAALA